MGRDNTGLAKVVVPDRGKLVSAASLHGRGDRGRGESSEGEEGKEVHLAAARRDVVVSSSR